MNEPTFNADRHSGSIKYNLQEMRGEDNLRSGKVYPATVLSVNIPFFPSDGY